jgi:S1-C subfamily serine protease
MTDGADQENTASSQPTEPTEPAEPPPPPQDKGAPPPGPPSATRGAWLVPKWAIAALAGFVVVAVLVGSAFALGRATAPGDDSSSFERLFEGRFPREPGEGPTLPRVPRQVSGVFLGVSTESSTDPQGVRIVNVVADSPAAGAGLQEGDVVTAVDGEAVSTPAELARRIRSHDAGDEVTIAYTRDGSASEAQVELAERSAEDARPS